MEMYSWQSKCQKMNNISSRLYQGPFFSQTAVLEREWHKKAYVRRTMRHVANLFMGLVMPKDEFSLTSTWEIFLRTQHDFLELRRAPNGPEMDKIRLTVWGMGWHMGKEIKWMGSRAQKPHLPLQKSQKKSQKRAASIPMPQDLSTSPKVKSAISERGKGSLY